LKPHQSFIDQEQFNWVWKSGSRLGEKRETRNPGKDWDIRLGSTWYRNLTIVYTLLGLQSNDKPQLGNQYPLPTSEELCSIEWRTKLDHIPPNWIGWGVKEISHN